MGEGYYSRREATVISTTFSVVSITFAIVVAETVHMQNQFFALLISDSIPCLVAAAIMPRIWPLNKISDESKQGRYLKVRTEALPEGKIALRYGFDTATEARY